MQFKQWVIAATVACVPFPALAQSWPARPVTMLVWSAAGSPVDIYGRTLARLLTAELGQNVVVENRTGGSGIVMVNSLVRAPADGYTIAANTLSLATLFSEKTAQFKLDDLQMVARSQIDPYGLIVHTSTPFKTIEQFVAFARKKPGYLNVAGPFAISSHRVAWEVFADVAKFRTTWVPYPGGGPALTAIAGGHVDAAATNPGNVKPMIDAGKVRVIAVSSEKRLEDFPDVPTYKEKGWDVVRYQWRGIMVRAGTPRPVVDRLASAIQKAQQAPAWKTYLQQVSQLDGFQGPEAFRAQLLQDIKETEAVKKKLGLVETQ
ncbi:MAG: Bug family tripartite tricarboxylate transporter substrate binding protein [Betaproteobacteria bacterium]|jgi:tripartite-type tricarboxylate transporter receptor subunit TctC|nr:tripartite tricarboxylate transporter substrate binding protein [Betaproteobacteria bacterium]